MHKEMKILKTFQEYIIFSLATNTFKEYLISSQKGRPEKNF